jgi:MFS family permease
VGKIALLIGYGIAFIGALAAFLLSEGRTKKRKFIVWGIALMLIISPFLSFAIGLTYGSIVQNGWAIPATIIILFPIGFIIGVIMLLVGVFKKYDADRPV